MGQRVVEPREAIREPITFDARLGWILGAIDAGITVQDARLRLVYAEQIAADLCGWSSPEEMVAATGPATLERFEMVDETGGPLDPSLLPGRRVLAGERPDPLLVGFKHLRTGALRWSLVRARLVRSGPDGERLVVSTFHDMTTQVEAGQASLADERRYREIVEALPVVAWLANPDGTLGAANGRWHAYTGMIAAVGPFPAPDRSIPTTGPALEAAWTVARATEEALDSTVRLRRHDGAFRWHVVRAVPLRREGRHRGLDRDGDRHRR